MWVILWAKMGCASGYGSKEQIYTWVKDDTSDEMLKDEAEEYLGSISWMQGSERLSYGFERVGPTLPTEIALHRIKRYEAEIEYAQRHIAFLKGQLPSPPDLKTRFERDPLPAAGVATECPKAKKARSPKKPKKAGIASGTRTRTG